MKKQLPEELKKNLVLLLNLYEQKKNLLEKIYEATVNCLQPGDTIEQKIKQVFTLLRKREGFIKQIDETDKQINTFLKFFDKCLQGGNIDHMLFSYSEWQIIEKEKSGIKELLPKILNKDYQLSSHIKEITAELSFHLKDIQEKKYALKSYLPKHNQANGVFFDQKK